MAEEIIQEEPKTFTQEEVNTIVSQRLARERREQLSPEEIAEYRQMKAASVQESEDKAKMASIIEERDKAVKDLEAIRNEVETKNRELYLRSKGITDEDLEYATFKISRAITEEKTFEQAADEYFEEHAKKPVRVDLGGSLSGSNVRATPSAVMNDLIRRQKR